MEEIQKQVNHLRELIRLLNDKVNKHEEKNKEARRYVHIKTSYEKKLPNYESNLISGIDT